MFVTFLVLNKKCVPKFAEKFYGYFFMQKCKPCFHKGDSLEYISKGSFLLLLLLLLSVLFCFLFFCCCFF